MATPEATTWIPSENGPNPVEEVPAIAGLAAIEGSQETEGIAEILTLSP